MVNMQSEGGMRVKTDGRRASPFQRRRHVLLLVGAWHFACIGLHYHCPSSKLVNTNDPYAGSSMKTLLRLLLLWNDQVCLTFHLVMPESAVCLAQFVSITMLHGTRYTQQSDLHECPFRADHQRLLRGPDQLSSTVQPKWDPIEGSLMG